jgi:NAD(P)-dependent dehydrogenase (short-subunit alcohol dehydrogenase family)
MSRLFETCDRMLGTLTALVNNAGILETQARVESMTEDRINRILAANVTSASCARVRPAADVDEARGAGGAIVNVRPGPQARLAR